MKAHIALWVAAAISPRRFRERWSEEWRADLAGSTEIGVSSPSIAVGALRLASVARAELVLTLIPRALLRSWPAITGVLLGAACAVCGIPVLTVVGLAMALQGTVLAVARRRARVRRAHARRLEVSG